MTARAYRALGCAGFEQLRTFRHCPTGRRFGAERPFPAHLVPPSPTSKGIAVITPPDKPLLSAGSALLEQLNFQRLLKSLEFMYPYQHLSFCNFSLAALAI